MSLNWFVNNRFHSVRYEYAKQLWQWTGTIKVLRLMQTTVNLPDSLYHSSEALAESRGATVEQFIVEAVKKEVQSTLVSHTAAQCIDGEVALPLIRSRKPGTLDLSKFDFDQLLT